MSTKPIKIAATITVLLFALGGLFYTTLREGTEYYKHVEEVMDNPSAWQGKRLQLHGFAEGIARKPNSLEYRFQIQSAGKAVHASYTGVVPDTFKNGSEVVVKGRLTPDGAFHGDEIMAKCPSKYEAGSPKPSGS